MYKNIGVIGQVSLVRQGLFLGRSDFSIVEFLIKTYFLFSKGFISKLPKNKISLLLNLTLGIYLWKWTWS